MAEKSENDSNENLPQDQDEKSPEAAWYCCFAGEPSYEEDLYASTSENCCCCCC